MGRVAGVVMLAGLLLSYGCRGDGEGASGNFDQARDARYLQQWCDTVVAAYPALMAVNAEANKEARVTYFEHSRRLISRYMPQTPPAGLEEWHLGPYGSATQLLADLERNAPSNELSETMDGFLAALAEPFPTVHVSRMQVAASGITSCQGAEMAGFEIGSVRLGGLDAPAWE